MLSAYSIIFAGELDDSRRPALDSSMAGAAAVAAARKITKGPKAIARWEGANIDFGMLPIGGCCYVR